MNLLAPNDGCPNCGETDVPSSGSSLAGRAAYECPNCGNCWTTAWNAETREDHRSRAEALRDPSRFAEPDPEGRYVYEGDPDW
jgi:transposase-like protein